MDVRAALFMLVVPILFAQPPVDVLTDRYDIARSGANLRETVLRPATVSAAQFGKLFERDVEGDMYAQPLIKTGVGIPIVGL